ncbi:16S rRNA (uracil(1498)-N(3))-methyltransferase [Haloimpatiens sp. FM7315]|uniref:16S rRNA (uracil(1498)-N(3))-methyltransferase n=1 Tax=Haloimpatiens sp. FM7315 TaxID=3298609 RepID=UPI00370A72F7
MHKFFVPKENIIEDKVTIKGEDVKHIYKVLRLSEGEKICINNSLGEEYLASIVFINKQEVRLDIIEKLEIKSESPVNIYIYQGLPKAAKMDLIVQKNTELGVKGITPIITERVIVKNELKEYKKIDRWNRIALEACKQCKRGVIPKINNPIDFQSLLKDLENFDLVVVPYENEEGYGIKKLVEDVKDKDIKNIAVIIGPEGGFEKEEIDQLSKMGAYIITLGPRILRTETAGFTCLSLLMYELGDLGGKL